VDSNFKNKLLDFVKKYDSIRSEIENPDRPRLSSIPSTKLFGENYSDDEYLEWNTKQWRDKYEFPREHENIDQPLTHKSHAEYCITEFIIKEGLQFEFNNNQKILYLGCHFAPDLHILDKFSKNIICVDLFDKFFDDIKNRNRDKDYNLEFYVTKGYELEGIENESVGLIYSVHAINRATDPVLEKYFDEFHRVLNKNGKMLLHLGIDHKLEEMLPRILPLCDEKFDLLNYNFQESMAVFGVGHVMLFEKK